MWVETRFSWKDIAETMRKISLILLALSHIFCLTFFLTIVAVSRETPPKPVNTLYIFAHQDDETDIAAKIASDVIAGKNVFALWITDGALSAPADVRERESREAMRILGVPQENLVFLGYPDMKSIDHLPDIHDKVLNTARKIKPDEITSNAYEGGHIDHDVSSFIASVVASELKPNPIHFEFSSYNIYKSVYRVGKLLPREGAKTLYTPLDGEIGELRKKATAAFESQAQALKFYESFIDKKTLRTRGEQYREAPAHDYLTRPADEPLCYETMIKPASSYDTFKKAVAAFIEANKSESE